MSSWRAYLDLGRTIVRVGFHPLFRHPQNQMAVLSALQAATTFKRDRGECFCRPLSFVGEQGTGVTHLHLGDESAWEHLPAPGRVRGGRSYELDHLVMTIINTMLAVSRLRRFINTTSSRDANLRQGDAILSEVRS